MSRNTPSNEIRDDEIDLLELFKRIGRAFSRWFQTIGTGLLIVLIFLLRNIIPLIFSFIIGIGLTYLLKWSTKPVYRSQVILRSNGVQNSDMIGYFDRLSVLIKEKNFNTLSSSLSIPREKAVGIKKIKTYWIIDIYKDKIPDYIDFKERFNIYDTAVARMQDRFVVDVIVTDPGFLHDISDGFIHYSNQNPVFRQQNEFRLRKNDELIARLNYDIQQLDSLQKLKYFEETRTRRAEKGVQMIFLQEQKTQLVYEDIYDLYKRKQILDEEKDLYSNILTVISDFYQPLKRYNGGLYYGKVIIPCTFGLTLIYLVLVRNRKKLRDIYRRY